MINYKISFHGDSTAIIKFGDEIDEDLNILVHKFLESLVKGFSENSSVLDIYPTYNSIIIDYDPNEILYENIKQKINSIKSFRSARLCSLENSFITYSLFSLSL